MMAALTAVACAIVAAQQPLAAQPSGWDTVWQAVPTLSEMAEYALTPFVGDPHSCAWRSDWLERAEAALRERVIGQPQAIELILDTLRVHHASKRREKPLVISLHGPTGVGKSLTHEVLARALYARSDARDRPIGVLVIGSVNYRSPELTLEYEEELRARVNQLVRRCSRGLIVLEEVQMMPARALSVFRPYFSRPTDSRDDFGYANVTFLLTSNLGAEAISERVYAARSREDVDVHALQDELQAQLDVHANNTDFTSRVDLTVPYFPFARAQLRALAARLLVELRDELREYFAGGAGIVWDEGVTNLLLDKLAWEGSDRERQIARYGFKTLVSKFSMLVHGPVRRHLQHALAGCAAQAAYGSAGGARLRSSVRVAVTTRRAAHAAAQGGHAGPGGEGDEPAGALAVGADAAEAVGDTRVVIVINADMSVESSRQVTRLPPDGSRPAECADADELLPTEATEPTDSAGADAGGDVGSAGSGAGRGGAKPAATGRSHGEWDDDHDEL